MTGRLTLAGLALAVFAIGAAGTVRGSMLALEERIVEIYQQRHPAVAKVNAVYVVDDGGEQRTVLYVGTGFFISPEGHMLTNANATAGSERIWVEIGDIAYAAELLGFDSVTNVSLLKVSTMPASAGFINLDERDTLAAIGSLIVAITSPLGMDPGPGLGIVTGWNTSYGEKILPTIYMRSNIPAEGGEGGSPVFDMSGRFIGMIVAGLPEIRSSFILPSRAIRRVHSDMLLTGKVEYGMFGLQTRQINAPDSEPHVVIEAILEGSPASEAGLKPGDILRAIGEFTIAYDRDLRTASFYTRPEQVVMVKIQRGEQELSLPMRVAHRPSPPSLQPPQIPPTGEGGE